MSRTQPPTVPTADVTHINLGRLLKRLEHNILSTDSNPRLRTDPYERKRVSANVDYARTLLLQLEQESSAIKVQTRKQDAQAELQSKRDLIRRLNQRLLELNQLDDSDADTSSDEEEETNEDGAPSLREYAPAQPTSNSIDTNPPPTSPPPADSTLRRRGPQSDAADTASTTALFSGRPSDPSATTPTNTNPNAPSSSLPQTEILLSHNRYEQEALTSSLISLAQSLKASSLSFAQSLEDEKTVLRRAEGALDKNAMGMEAAERRMGTLRRMTEGQGWWGRIKLYAIVAAMWLFAFLLVFVGPKLRF